jgi:pyrimidine-nucleoside phosphorylase
MNNRHIACVLTNMDEPLGYAVGNSLEVIEAIDTLKGKGPKDLNELIIKLGSLMASFGLDIDVKTAELKVKENLTNNQGYNKLLEWVKAQGGDINCIEIADNIKEIKSTRSGYIKKINALEIGKLARVLGAGRLTKDDIIDPKVGFVLNKKVGDFVQENETLITVYYDKKNG